MHAMKPSPRTEYRESQLRRVKESPPLAARFPDLAALKVDFSYLNPDGTSRNREVKYSVNLDRVSSVFRIDCLNPDCVGGDYDLSVALAHAVAIRQGAVTGELRCEGWQDRFTIDRVRCHQRIAFTLSLGYRNQRAD
jgi:hypothetical protein